MDILGLASLLMYSLFALGRYKQTQRLNDRAEAFSMRSQELQMQHEKDLQAQSMQYNSYPSQVKQMMEAGLNPAMMYGSASAGGTSVGIPSVGQAQLPTYHNPYDEIQGEGAINAMLSVIAQKAQINQMDAQTAKAVQDVAESKANVRLMGSQAQKNFADSMRTTIQAMLDKNDLKYRDTMNQLEIIGRRVGIDKVNEECKNIMTDTQLKELQGQYSQVQINNAALEYKKNQYTWDRCAEYIIRGIQEQTRGQIYEADKSFYQAKELMYKTGQMEKTGTYTGANGLLGTGITAPLMAEVVMNRRKALENLSAELLQKGIDKFKELFGKE